MLAAMKIEDIPDRLRAAGRSQGALARYLNLDASSLSKTIKGSRRLKADELVKIEEFFNDSPGEQGPRVQQLSERRRAAPRRIPVYGYVAAGGTERIAYNPGGIVDWVDAPAMWSGAGDLVVVRVIGDSMEPRYFAGESVFVHLNLPPGRGQDCLIEFHDGSAVIKSYRGQRDGQVFAWQYNPPSSESNEVRYSSTDVKAIHAVDLPSRVSR